MTKGTPAAVPSSVGFPDMNGFGDWAPLNLYQGVGVYYLDICPL